MEVKVPFLSKSSTMFLQLGTRTKRKSHIGTGRYIFVLL